VKKISNSRASFSKLLVKGVGVSAVSALLVGCSSGGPERIQPPSFDPAASAAKAMEMYDTDSDGFIAGSELEVSPGINASMKKVDANQDGKVSEQEISDRISALASQKVGLMTFTCDVTLDGRPLEGATVTFEPEEFLGDTINAASDSTNIVGTASPSIPKDKRPSTTTPPGIQAGIYKVRISKLVNGQETVPAIYNSETILGKEVARDDSAIKNKQVRFTLTTKK
jgi:hypothetical protein